jgi:hypothetical protein
LLWLGLALCSLAVAAFGLWIYGFKRWTADIAVVTRRLETARIVDNGPSASAHPLRFDLRELEGLPAPVQRYFRLVLRQGQPLISAVTIDMVGTFNMSAIAERWKPFTSRQRVITRRPGFLWDAQVWILPGLLVRVVDSYIAGVGLLHAAILGVFTVAKVSGEGEIARGEFMRYVAEAAWYPTALLPSAGVRWQAIDDRSASATVAEGSLTLTLLFQFNDAGLIEAVRAAARGAMVGSKVVMMPWECCLSDYEVREGMTVPIAGEAAWLQPEGRKPYFRGTISSLTYEFPP